MSPRPDGLNADELAALLDQLTTIDQFLRSSPTIAHHLATFCSTGPDDTGLAAAYTLIDTLGFTIIHLRSRAQPAAQQPIN